MNSFWILAGMGVLSLLVSIGLGLQNYLATACH